VILGLVVFALFVMKELVFVILTSVVLASFIRTAAVSVKNRFGLSRILSVALMYLITFCALAGIFYFFIPVLVVEISNLLPVLAKYLPANLPIVQNLDVNTLGAISAEGVAAGESLGPLVDNFRSFLLILSSGFGNTLSMFFGGVLNIVVVIVVSFYLSVSADGIESFLRILSPIDKEAYVIDLWKRSQRKIALWMQGQLFLGVVIGILTFIGLTLLGVEQAILLAVVAAIFELIPFGIFLAAVPAISIAFGSGGISLALMVAALYTLIQQLEGYLISPLVMNKMTGVSPLVVILSVLVGVHLAGFWGLILAVPVAVTLLEYINDIEKERLMRLQNEQ
jgi:predicted PurR-regulated permease PerM